QIAFLAGAFFLFCPSGLLAVDIPQLGADTPVRLAGHALMSGGIAVAWMLAVTTRRGRVWVPVVIVAPIVVTMEFSRVFGPQGAALAGEELRRRLGADVGWATTSVLVGFSCLSYVVRSESSRHALLQADADLARDIHRRLVPPIDVAIGRFEFRGASI